MGEVRGGRRGPQRLRDCLRASASCLVRMRRVAILSLCIISPLTCYSALSACVQAEWPAFRSAALPDRHITVASPAAACLAFKYLKERGGGACGEGSINTARKFLKHNTARCSPTGPGGHLKLQIRIRCTYTCALCTSPHPRPPALSPPPESPHSDATVSEILMNCATHEAAPRPRHVCSALVNAPAMGWDVFRATARTFSTSAPVRGYYAGSRWSSRRCSGPSVYFPARV